MKLTRALGLTAGAAVLAATVLAAQQPDSAQDRALTAYQIIPGSGPTVSVGSTPQPRKLSPAKSVQLSRSALAARARAVDPRWARRTASAAGIPLPALTAYARASVLVPEQCRIAWTTLAGVGWVESQHGTIGGRRLRPDGRSSRPILGPALSGGGEFAAIAATRESARWHGDRVWDHAVGPMQFIPSTWRTWQADGDGDGVADPNDIDDASLAAARYLCQSGDLMAGDTWAQAIFSYNHSADYVLNVYTAADAYADRTD